MIDHPTFRIHVLTNPEANVWEGVAMSGERLNIQYTGPTLVLDVSNTGYEGEPIRVVELPMEYPPHTVHMMSTWAMLQHLRNYLFVAEDKKTAIIYNLMEQHRVGYSHQTGGRTTAYFRVLEFDELQIIETLAGEIVTSRGGLFPGWTAYDVEDLDDEQWLDLLMIIGDSEDESSEQD